ncbi:hypothetical protein J2792_004304 [Novosphingobium capsulatum]|uniref:DUF2939 domain-containing protein n=1 Tax=Novosphingobium capsulatum TaxID=13688 RepID=A0ABU1MST8_9SPHN|nr:DUF2939 domain-containing protein [Novosphingobium capsulatum]MDR6513410.1 hypothetical protein [Novosphingobium capsulatum]
MRKTSVLVLALVVVGFVLAYFGSPYLAAHDLREALKAGDADRIEADVDISAVKDSLKSQLSAALMRKMQSDPDTKGNAFAALGALIVPAIIDKAIDTYVTPDGLAAIMKGQKPGGTQDNSTKNAVNYTSDEDYIGFDRFRVNNEDKQSRRKGPSLVFERRGMFSWKLIKIELPQDLFDTTNDQPGSPSAQSGNDPNAASAAQAPASEPDLPTVASANDAHYPSASDLNDYRFQDFPSEPFNGPLARPNFTGSQREFRAYRTMISDGAMRGPVFAGSVAIAQFGCGTDCSTGYAIDLKNGRIVPLPVGGETNSDLDLEYHVESKLLKAAWKGAAKEFSNTPPDCRGFAYFEWTGQAFRQIKASSHSPVCE